MKFIADVNVAQTVIKLLRQNGHSVLDLKKKKPTISDTGIIKLAAEERRIIITHDKDFLGLTQFPKYQVGIILIRLKIQNASHHYKRLQILLNTKSAKEISNALNIVTEESASSYPFSRD